MKKTEVNEFIKSNYQAGMGLKRSESVSRFAKDFNSTIPSVYRWIKNGNYYVMDGEIYCNVSTKS